jgi:hypothetical protein
MTHRTVVNCETGEITQVEYTTEKQAVHDAAVAQQEAEATRLAAEALAAQQAVQPPAQGA